MSQAGLPRTLPTGQGAEPGIGTAWECLRAPRRWAQAGSGDLPAGQQRDLLDERIKGSACQRGAHFLSWGRRGEGRKQPVLGPPTALSCEEGRSARPPPPTSPVVWQPSPVSTVATQGWRRRGEAQRSRECSSTGNDRGANVGRKAQARETGDLGPGRRPWTLSARGTGSSPSSWGKRGLQWGGRDSRVAQQGKGGPRGQKC